MFIKIRFSGLFLCAHIYKSVGGLVEDTIS